MKYLNAEQKNSIIELVNNNMIITIRNGVVFNDIKDTELFIKRIISLYENQIREKKENKSYTKIINGKIVFLLDYNL